MGQSSSHFSLEELAFDRQDVNLDSTLIPAVNEQNLSNLTDIPSIETTESYSEIITTTSSQPATLPLEPDQDSPFDPTTGEINWDCPCLKGALDPPCGDLFKVAFSCFVASKTEPRGEDCLEKFIALQECFRSHPEKYDPHYSDKNDVNYAQNEDPAFSERHQETPSENVQNNVPIAGNPNINNLW